MTIDLKDMKTEWNTALVLDRADDSVIKKMREDIEKAFTAFENKWRNDASYLSDIGTMKDALDEYERLMRDYTHGGKETYYFWLKQNLNSADPKIKAGYNSSEMFYVNLASKIQFFSLSIAHIPKDKQEIFLSASELKDYKHFLEGLFESSKHLLSENEEKIMMLKEKSSFSNWVKMTEEFLEKEEREVEVGNGKKEKKTYEGLISLMKSKDKRIRDGAEAAFSDIMTKHEDVAEHEMNSILGDKKVDDQLRGFTAPDSQRLLDDDIDPNVVKALLDAVKARFSISQKYYALKAKLMGQERIRYAERNVDIGNMAHGEFDFEKSVNIVRDTFATLDDEFVQIFDSYLKNGQIDAFPRKSKSSGGFCVGWNMKEPTFILLNHTNNLRDVLTIAHEAGHGMNNEYMKRKQNALNFGTPKSTAEVASTFMEDFVFRKLLEGVDDETRFSLLAQKLEDDISKIFRQVALYLFEIEIHDTFRKKDFISKDEIGAMFAKHMQAYLGHSVEMKGAENWWVYWSHIRALFYVYSYASGQLISQSMQAETRKDKKFIGKVKEFLSAGTSASPKDIFMKMGIDITKEDFWNAGLDQVEKLLGETEELAKKLGKIN